MASAREIAPNQVWTDSRGTRFRVIGMQPDGRFACQNLDTNRTVMKGPRAFVTRQPDQTQAPQGYMDPYPQPRRGPPPPRRLSAAQLAAGFGGGVTGPVRTSTPPAPADLGFYEPEQPAFMPPPPPRAQRAPVHAAPMPSGWAPPQGQPGLFPSALVAYLVEKLSQLPPERANSPSFVSQQFAVALSHWKSRPQPW